MAKFILSLNKKYIITTFGLSYINQLVEVVGLVNYSEAMKLSDIHVLALNEKIIDDDYTSYFENIEFYKCKIVGTENIIIVWADIIDSTKSSLVGEKFNYKTTLQLPISASTVSKDTIIAELIQTALKYGATLVFTPVSTDNNAVVDILQERLTEAQNVIRSLQSLSTIIPMIENISTGDLINKINDISSGIDTINERIATIASGI